MLLSTKIIIQDLRTYNVHFPISCRIYIDDDVRRYFKLEKDDDVRIEQNVILTVLP